MGEMGAPLCNSEDSTTPGVWYKLPIAFTARVEVSTCNQANFDTRILIYTGACGSLVCNFGVDNTDFCEGGTTCITVYVPVAPQDIYILVNGQSGAVGNFDLTVRVFTLPVSGGGGRDESKTNVFLG